MCGRFSQFSVPEEIAAHFVLEDVPTLIPRYNVAPGQDVAVVRLDASEGKRTLDMLRWGLIPGFSQNPTGGRRMINARSETVFAKPSFRKSARQRRALIPVDGFYEWRKNDKKRQPHFIRLKGGEPFALAGLWETWKNEETAIESCLILTTNANDLVDSLHDRMPVIIKPGDYDRWLNPDVREKEELGDLFVPFSSGMMEMWVVGTYVNKVTHEGPTCIEPDGGQGRLF